MPLPANEQAKYMIFYFQFYLPQMHLVFECAQFSTHAIEKGEKKEENVGKKYKYNKSIANFPVLMM